MKELTFRPMTAILNRIKPRNLLLVGITAMLIACGSSSDSDDDKAASSCDNPGPGAQPASGSGTESDPFDIVLGTLYGGCARGDADPGPIYALNLPVGATYTITQSNGTSDIELFIYDVNGNLLFVIDSVIAGFNESGTTFLSAGDYGVEVFSNTTDSAFSIRVTN